MTDDELELKILEKYIAKHKEAEIADPQMQNKCARELDMREILRDFGIDKKAELEYHADLWLAQLTSTVPGVRNKPLRRCSKSDLNTSSHQYNARAYIDPHQKIVQEYEYDSFGNLKDQKNRIKQPYAFTSREYDRETGLYYYRARYYDAEIGRFMSEDPSFKLSSNINIPNYLYQQLLTPQSLNTFVYAENKPVTFNDPSGFRIRTCYRPLRGSFLGYHQYIRVNNTSYGYFEDSNVHTNDPWDTADGWGVHCVTVREDDCLDECIRWARQSFDPPQYNGYNYNCYSWVSDILRLCGL